MKKYQKTEENKRQYAIVNKLGYFLTAPNEIGSGEYISLLTKKEAKLEIKTYYLNNKMKKMKVMF